MPFLLLSLIVGTTADLLVKLPKQKSKTLQAILVEQEEANHHQPIAPFPDGNLEIGELDGNEVLRREHARIRREKARRARDTANIEAVVEAIRSSVIRIAYVLVGVLTVVLLFNIVEDLIPHVHNIDH